MDAAWAALALTVVTQIGGGLFMFGKLSAKFEALADWRRELTEWRRDDVEATLDDHEQRISQVEYRIRP